jgi:hypothetical protein
LPSISLFNPKKLEINELFLLELSLILELSALESSLISD